MANHVLHILPHLGVGGAQKIVSGLLSAQTNHFVFAIRTLPTEDTMPVPSKQAIIYPSEKIQIFSIKVAYHILQTIRKKNIRIVHLHLPKTLLYVPIIKLFFRGAVLIYHEHGLIVADDDTHRRRWWYVPLLRSVQPFISGVICISNQVKELFQTSLPTYKNKIKLLYNFVEIKARLPKKGHHDNKKFTIGFIGRIIERKGWLTFVQAIDILVQRGINIHAEIAGSGNEEESLQYFIKEHDLRSVITFRGYVGNVETVFQRLDCLVVPSHWEPLGMTHLEGASFGIPLILSDLESFRELFTDKLDAMFCDSQNPLALADCIQQLYHDEQQRKSMVQHAHKTVEKYSLQNYINQLNSFYDAIT